MSEVKMNDHHEPTIDEWLKTRLAELVEDDTPIDPNEDLVMYGLDSIAIMTLSAELKDWGVTVSFEELARKATLNAWRSLIALRVA